MRTIERATARGGEGPGRRANGGQCGLFLVPTDPPPDVQTHQGASQLGLEDDQERQPRNDRRGVEDPARDQQVELSRQERAHTQRQDAQRKPEGTRLAAPLKQKVQGDGEHEKIDAALPVNPRERECEHRHLTTL